MAESYIAIELVSDDDKGPGWFFTSRPFELDINHYDPTEIAKLENLFGSWDKAKYAFRI